MPYPVRNLIEGQGSLTTVKKNDLVSKALSLMLEHDYSQLPVVDEENYPLGMITYEGILRALRNFGAQLDELIVDNVYNDDKTVIFDIDDDVFDLLNKLQDTNAVLITQMGMFLDGIVTSYDTTEYFRRRSEDLMYIEDIETIIREFILAYFTDEEDQVDEEALAEAVRQLDPKQPFDRLSLYKYIALLIHENRWDFYGPIFQIARERLEKLLDDIRQIRNYLAHFRGEITSDQREQLQFCSDWLGRIQNAYSEKMQEEYKLKIVTQSPKEATSLEGAIIPVGEEITRNTSKYAPLAEWLQSQPSSEDRLRISFEQIEEIIGDELPASAHNHRAWWANDAVGHVQSKQWLDAGWRVGYRNMSSKEVTFVRIKERERAYIDFFGPLMTRLREKTDIEFKDSSPGGTNWIEVIRLPENGPQKSIITFSFALNDRYRIELYIDTGDQIINKAVFDELYLERQLIEQEMGEKLSWERLDSRRASRIALYNDGNIENDQTKLKELEDWTLEKLPKFYNAIFGCASQILEKHT